MLIHHSPGTVSIFRYGAGPNGIMRTLGQFMGASGATFGYDPSPFLNPAFRLTKLARAASSCPLAASSDPTPPPLSNKPTGMRDDDPSSLPTNHNLLPRDPTCHNQADGLKRHAWTHEEHNDQMYFGYMTTAFELGMECNIVSAQPKYQQLLASFLVTCYRVQTFYCGSCG